MTAGQTTTQPTEGLSVIGEGRVQAVADQAVLVLRVEVGGESATEALDATTQQALHISQVLQQKGIDRADIDITWLGAQPIYAHPAAQAQPGMSPSPWSPPWSQMGSQSGNLGQEPRRDAPGGPLGNGPMAQQPGAPGYGMNGHGMNGYGMNGQQANGQGMPSAAPGYGHPAAAALSQLAALQQPHAQAQSHAQAPAQQPVQPPGCHYVAGSLLRVTLRTLNRLGEVLDAATAAGARAAVGMTQGVQDERGLRHRAVDAAMQDGWAKAEMLAHAAGRRLGRPRAIHEEVAAPALPSLASLGSPGGGPQPGGEVVQSARVRITFDWG